MVLSYVARTRPKPRHTRVDTTRHGHGCGICVRFVGHGRRSRERIWKKWKKHYQVQSFSDKIPQVLEAKIVSINERVKNPTQIKKIKSGKEQGNEKDKTKERSTWRPAQEEREMGFFLSLSLLAVEVLPIIKPFAPFPGIFPAKNKNKPKRLQIKKRRETERILVENQWKTKFAL